MTNQVPLEAVDVGECFVADLAQRDGVRMDQHVLLQLNVRRESFRAFHAVVRRRLGRGWRRTERVL